jgi:alkanesulfonate monooxygenase SsuD/methylene tetrahydromethanopterin reductase-like flavin-dependent oxidoreductase (luciferase family)
VAAAALVAVTGGEFPMDLGKIGIWAMLEAMTMRETLDFAKTIEKHGYQALWIPEGPGRDRGALHRHPRLH